MNYHDRLAQLDIVLAAWQHGEADAQATILALVNTRSQIIATEELKSVRWLLPLTTSWINRLTETFTKEVAVNA